VRRAHLQLIGSLLVALAIVVTVIVVVSARLGSVPAEQLNGDHHGGGDRSGRGHGGSGE